MKRLKRFENKAQLLRHIASTEDTDIDDLWKQYEQQMNTTMSEHEQWGNYTPYDEPKALMLPCKTCGSHMSVTSGVNQWWCSFCGDTEPMDKSALIDTLSSLPYDRGYPGVLRGECPQCHDDYSVDGDPDGTLCCTNYGCDYYIGQYSDEWYVYAAWYSGDERIEVLQ